MVLTRFTLKFFGLIILVFSNVSIADDSLLIQSALPYLSPSQIQQYISVQNNYLSELVQTTEGLQKISGSQKLNGDLARLNELQLDLKNGNIERFVQNREDVFIKHELAVAEVLGDEKNSNGISLKPMLVLAAVGASIAGYVLEDYQAKKVASTDKCLYAINLFMEQGVRPVGVAAWGRALYTQMPKYLAPTANVSLGVITAWDMVDRYLLSGATGLLNISSGLDALLIVALLPRPALKSFEKEFSKKFAMSFASFQQKASVGVVLGNGSYGLWQFIFADSIAEKLRQEGQDVTPAQVRMNGILDIFIAMWGGKHLYLRSQAKLLTSKTYIEFLKTKSSTLSGLSPLKVPKHLLNAYGQDWKTLKGASKGGAELGNALVYTGYQSFIATGAVLLLLSNPDFLFNYQASEIPLLKEGEVAVEFNGFAENDITYYLLGGNANAQVENTQINEKNGRVVKLPFSSPRDFLDNLRKIGEQKGKIKYLRISSHGLPGMLVPHITSNNSNGQIFIDEKFLKENEVELREIGRKYFVKGATIQLYSCLVGGNLKEEITFQGQKFERKSGDNFIKKLGDTLLVSGGNIESSRRYVISLEYMFDSLLDRALYNGYRTKVENPNMPKPEIATAAKSSQQMKNEAAAINSGNSNKEINSNHVEQIKSDTDAQNKNMSDSMSGLLAANFTRVSSMNLFEIIKKFGLGVESPLGTNAFRRDEFLPQE